MAPHAGGRPRLPINATAVLASYAAGRSVAAIAKALGVDRSRVRRVVEDAGVLRDDRGAHWAGKRAERKAS